MSADKINAATGRSLASHGEQSWVSTEFCLGNECLFQPFLPAWDVLNRVLPMQAGWDISFSVLLKAHLPRQR